MSSIPLAIVFILTTAEASTGRAAHLDELVTEADVVAVGHVIDGGSDSTVAMALDDVYWSNVEILAPYNIEISHTSAMDANASSQYLLFLDVDGTHYAFTGAVPPMAFLLGEETLAGLLVDFAFDPVPDTRAALKRELAETDQVSGNLLAHVLTALGDETDTEWLESEARTESREVIRRAWAVQEMAACEECVLTLLDLAESGPPAVRISAITALGRSGAVEAVPILIDSAGDVDVGVRRGSYHALGVIGTNEAADALIASLTRETDPFAQTAIVEAVHMCSAFDADRAYAAWAELDLTPFALELLDAIGGAQ